MTARIHLLAGLNGAGKTTLARQLEATLPAVRFSLDEWMLRLHGLSFDDERYPELAGKCRALIWDLTAQVVRTGTSVVLDWNMWSRERRADAVLPRHGARSRSAICTTSWCRCTWPSSERQTVAIPARIAWMLMPSAISPISSNHRTASEGFVLHVVGDGGDQTHGSVYGGDVSGRV